MSKLRDDLYQRFNGFKPVKNTKGEWYYIDPRYESNDPRSQIKVANENSPNPKINEILEDDMNNNPEDYYISSLMDIFKCPHKNLNYIGRKFSKSQRYAASAYLTSRKER